MPRTRKHHKKPKRTLLAIIERKTPDLPFKEARRGLQLLVHDIGSYYKNTKAKDPKSLIVRTLSTAQIILVVLALVGCCYLAFWILSNLLW